MNYTIELNDCILLGSGAEGSVFLTPEGFAIKQFNTIKAAKKEVSILDDVKDSPFFPNVLIRVSNIVVREYVQGENLYEYIQKKGLSYSLSKEIIDLLEDLKRLKRMKKENFLYAAIITGSIDQVENVLEGDEIDMCEGMERMAEGFRKEGEVRGVIRGRSEGKLEEKQNTLLTLLTCKLGNLSKETENTIRSSTMEKLNKLTLSIFDIQSEEDALRIIN